MTNRTEQPSRGTAQRVIAFAVFALLSLCLPGAASAQWTTSGNTTSTTNNVGIGTATPENSEIWNKVLDVYGNPHAKFSIRTPGIDARVQAHESGPFWGAPVGMVIGTRTNHPLSFGTAATSRMTIANTGNVGVGTTSPAHRLHVVGSGQDGIIVDSMAFPQIRFDRGGVAKGYLAVTGTAGGYAAGTMPDSVVLSSNNALHLISNAGIMGLTVSAGNVGVGTTAPATKLHVAGDITVDGNINAKYQDVAEWVPSTQKLRAGTVVVLDQGRANHVLASTASYDTAVAGVISARPGLTLGEVGEGKALVATTGRVKVKVDATRAAIKIGDLLVTSDVAGVAIRSEPVMVGGRKIHAPGTIIGKALEPLAGGTGEILVLLSLQ